MNAQNDSKASNPKRCCNCTLGSKWFPFKKAGSYWLLGLLSLLISTCIINYQFCVLNDGNLLVRLVETVILEALFALLYFLCVWVYRLVRG